MPRHLLKLSEHESPQPLSHIVDLQTRPASQVEPLNLMLQPACLEPERGAVQASHSPAA